MPRDYAASGCWEMTIQGPLAQRNVGGVCALRCLEWALNDGQFVLGVPNVENAKGPDRRTVMHHHRETAVV